MLLKKTKKSIDLEKLDDKINLDSTNEKKDLPYRIMEKLTLLALVKTQKNNEQPKVVVYHKFGSTVKLELARS